MELYKRLLYLGAIFVTVITLAWVGAEFLHTRPSQDHLPAKDTNVTEKITPNLTDSERTRPLENAAFGEGTSSTLSRLSYLRISTTLPFLVIDPAGHRTGLGDKGTFNEIPDANMTAEALNNAENPDAPPQPTDYVFESLNPHYEKYTILVFNTAPRVTEYRIDFLAYVGESINRTVSRSSVLATGSSDTYTVEYSTVPDEVIRVQHVLAGTTIHDGPTDQ